MVSSDQKNPNSEPLIQELLSDPIAVLLMQKDGVQPELLEPLLQKASGLAEADTELA